MKSILCTLLMCGTCMGQLGGVPQAAGGGPDYAKMQTEALQQQAFFMRQQAMAQQAMLQQQAMAQQQQAVAQQQAMEKQQAQQRVLLVQPVQPRAVPVPAASAVKGSEEYKKKYDDLARVNNERVLSMQRLNKDYEVLYKSYEKLVSLHVEAKKALEAGCTREEAIELLSKDWRK